MIRTLYIYWAQGFHNAPVVIQKSLLSWKVMNPTWKIIELDDTNLSTFVDIQKDMPNILRKNITKIAYSDIVRIYLLEKYGGCWCDATTICVKPLDDWLPQCIQSGFFAFDRPTSDRLLSSWFLYSEKENYIVTEWKKKTIQYWKAHQKVTNYFWFHHLFGEKYNTDEKFRIIWDNTPKFLAKEPLLPLQNHRLLNPVTDEVRNHVIQGLAPLYKITYKYDKSKYNDKTTLAYMLSLVKQ